MQKLSRMESNKAARRILSRNQVDLGRCQYSCSASEIKLTGALYKTDGSNFSGTQVRNMIEELNRGLHGIMVIGDMDNWNFSSDSITNLGEKSENKDTNKDNEEVGFVIDECDLAN